MKVTVYGSHQCPGTMSALVKLFDADITSDFRDVLGSHAALKEFLKLREDPMFDEKKAADKLGFPFVLLIGEDEIAQGKVSLKDMHTGAQTLLTPDEAAAAVRAALAQKENVRVIRE